MISPVMSHWNDLTDEERTAIVEVWEAHTCGNCGSISPSVYHAIRKILAEGEKRYLRATLEGGYNND
jgi:hypothetical protein